MATISDTLVMKVFRINDCDWWMADTLETAVADYMKETGLPEDEAVDEPGELTPEEMQRLVFVVDDGGPEDCRHSFAEELARRVAAGAASQLFASTEY